MTIDDLLEKLSDDIGALDSFCEAIIHVAPDDSEHSNLAGYVKHCLESMEVNLSNLACAINDND